MLYRGLLPLPNYVAIAKGISALLTHLPEEMNI